MRIPSPYDIEQQNIHLRKQNMLQNTPSYHNNFNHNSTISPTANRSVSQGPATKSNQLYYKQYDVSRDDFNININNNRGAKNNGLGGYTYETTDYTEQTTVAYEQPPQQRRNKSGNEQEQPSRNGGRYFYYQDFDDSGIQDVDNVGRGRRQDTISHHHYQAPIILKDGQEIDQGYYRTPVPHRSKRQVSTVQNYHEFDREHGITPSPIPGDELGCSTRQTSKYIAPSPRKANLYDMEKDGENNNCVECANTSNYGKRSLSTPTHKVYGASHINNMTRQEQEEGNLVGRSTKSGQYMTTYPEYVDDDEFTPRRHHNHYAENRSTLRPGETQNPHVEHVRHISNGQDSSLSTLERREGRSNYNSTIRQRAVRGDAISTASTNPDDIYWLKPEPVSPQDLSAPGYFSSRSVLAAVPPPRPTVITLMPTSPPQPPQRKGKRVKGVRPASVATAKPASYPTQEGLGRSPAMDPYDPSLATSSQVTETNMAYADDNMIPLDVISTRSSGGGPTGPQKSGQKKPSPQRTFMAFQQMKEAMNQYIAYLKVRINEMIERYENIPPGSFLLHQESQTPMSNVKALKQKQNANKKKDNGEYKSKSVGYSRGRKHLKELASDSISVHSTNEVRAGDTDNPIMLERKIKNAQRLLKHLEYHGTKVDRLYDDYLQFHKTRTSAKTMSFAYCDPNNISNSAKAMKESLIQLEAERKNCDKNMYLIENRLQALMGTFHFVIKEVSGYARVGAGDQFQIVTKYGFPKFKKFTARCKVDRKLFQLWDKRGRAYPLLLHEYMQLKAKEIKTLNNHLLMKTSLDPLELLSVVPILKYIKMTPNGSLKLNVLFFWNPLGNEPAEELDFLYENSAFFDNFVMSKTPSEYVLPNLPPLLTTVGGGSESSYRGSALDLAGQQTHSNYSRGTSRPLNTPASPYNQRIVQDIAYIDSIGPKPQYQMPVGPTPIRSVSENFRKTKTIRTPSVRLDEQPSYYTQNNTHVQEEYGFHQRPYAETHLPLHSTPDMKPRPKTPSGTRFVNYDYTSSEREPLNTERLHYREHPVRDELENQESRDIIQKSHMEYPSIVEYRSHEVNRTQTDRSPQREMIQHIPSHAVRYGDGSGFNRSSNDTIANNFAQSSRNPHPQHMTSMAITTSADDNLNRYDPLRGIYHPSRDNLEFYSNVYKTTTSTNKQYHHKVMRENVPNDLAGVYTRSPLHQDESFKKYPVEDFGGQNNNNNWRLQQIASRELPIHSASSPIQPKNVVVNSDYEIGRDFRRAQTQFLQPAMGLGHPAVNYQQIESFHNANNDIDSHAYNLPPPIINPNNQYQRPANQEIDPFSSETLSNNYIQNQRNHTFDPNASSFASPLLEDQIGGHGLIGNQNISNTPLKAKQPTSSNLNLEPDFRAFFLELDRCRSILGQKYMTADPNNFNKSGSNNANHTANATLFSGTELRELTDIAQQFYEYLCYTSPSQNKTSIMNKINTQQQKGFEALPLQSSKNDSSQISAHDSLGQVRPVTIHYKTVESTANDPQITAPNNSPNSPQSPLSDEATAKKKSKNKEGVKKKGTLDSNIINRALRSFDFLSNTDKQLFGESKTKKDSKKCKKIENSPSTPLTVAPLVKPLGSDPLTSPSNINAASPINPNISSNKKNLNTPHSMLNTLDSGFDSSGSASLERIKHKGASHNNFISSPLFKEGINLRLTTHDQSLDMCLKIHLAQLVQTLKALSIENTRTHEQEGISNFITCGKLLKVIKVHSLCLEIYFEIATHQGSANDLNVVQAILNKYTNLNGWGNINRIVTFWSKALASKNVGLDFGNKFDSRMSQEQQILLINQQAFETALEKEFLPFLLTLHTQQVISLVFPKICAEMQRIIIFPPGISVSHLLSELSNPNIHDPASPNLVLTLGNYITLLQFVFYIKLNNITDFKAHLDDIAKELEFREMFNAGNQNGLIKYVLGMGTRLPPANSFDLVCRLLCNNEEIHRFTVSYLHGLAHDPIKRKRAIYHALACLESKDVIIRCGACRALQNLKATESISSLLNTFTDDPNVRVNESARIALLNLGPAGVKAYENFVNITAKNKLHGVISLTNSNPISSYVVSNTITNSNFNTPPNHEYNTSDLHEKLSDQIYQSNPNESNNSHRMSDNDDYKRMISLNTYFDDDVWKDKINSDIYDKLRDRPNSLVTSDFSNTFSTYVASSSRESPWQQHQKSWFTNNTNTYDIPVDSVPISVFHRPPGISDV